MTQFVNFFTSKGGQGCTVVAAAFAVQQTRPTLVVDWGGDMSAALGIGHVADDAPYEVNENLWVVKADDKVTDLGLHADFDMVINDRGCTTPGMWDGVSFLVTRHCYLALKRGVAAVIEADTCHGIITIGEPGRALTDADVSRVYGVPVVASIPFDPSIARCVDAGLLAARYPQNLRPLANLLREFA